jgi:class 3 adenylate cyclase
VAAKETPGHVLASRRAVEESGSEAEHWEFHGALELRGLREPLEVAVPKGSGNADRMANTTG